jgi:hypothetical protein
MVERGTGHEFRSPLDDDPSEHRDTAYLGRLHRPDARPFIRIAGVQAIGSALPVFAASR